MFVRPNGSVVGSIVVKDLPASDHAKKPRKVAPKAATVKPAASATKTEATPPPAPQPPAAEPETVDVVDVPLKSSLD